MTAGVAAQVAGVLWILQWTHALVTHGTTQVNQKQLWLGMTWLDSTKFLIVAYLLLLPGVIYLRRTAVARGDKFATRAGSVVVVALGVSALATAMEFRLLEWGTYSGTFDSNVSPMSIAGPVRMVVSSLVLTGGLAMLALRGAVRGDSPYWLVPILVVGALATVFIGGPLPPVPGMAWLVFGGWLLVQTRPKARQTVASDNPLLRAVP